METFVLLQLSGLHLKCSCQEQTCCTSTTKKCLLVQWLQWFSGLIWQYTWSWYLIFLFFNIHIIQPKHLKYFTMSMILVRISICWLFSVILNTVCVISKISRGEKCVQDCQVLSNNIRVTNIQTGWLWGVADFLRSTNGGLQSKKSQLYWASISISVAHLVD